MFDLEYEVDAWSKDFAGGACGRNDRVEELKDHLFCEIEENIKEGLGEESAFLAATRRFGISEDLKAAFRKGRGIKAILCEADKEFQFDHFSTKKLAILMAAFLVSFAVLTFGITYLIKTNESFSYLSSVLYVLMFVPILFSIGLQKQSRAECAYIKRMIKKVF